MDRTKDTFNKIIKQIVSNKITICLILFVSIIGFLIMHQIIKESYNGEHEYKLTEFIYGDGRASILAKDVEIRQKFFSPTNNMNKIKIMMLMQGISTDSNINAKVIEIDNDKIICDEIINCSKYKDGEFIEICFESQNASKNKKYEVILTGIDGDITNSIQFPLTSYNNLAVYDCKSNDENYENNLVINIGYTKFISNRLQILIYSIFIIFTISAILFFSSDEKMLNNLEFTPKSMMDNFKNNWYWMLSIIPFYLIYIRYTKMQYFCICFAIMINLFILTQIKSIKKWILKVDWKIKLYSLISTIGICFFNIKICTQSIKGSYIWNVLNNYINLEKLPINIIIYIVSIMSSFIIFVLVIWILNYIINKIKFVFEDINKKEMITYIVMFFIICCLVCYMFVNSYVSYGNINTGHSFDLLYTSDSGVIAGEDNSYMNLYHCENDIRQPLFAVFAAPILGFAYAISIIIPGGRFVMPLSMNIFQLILFFITNLMLAKLLNMQKKERIAFIVLSFCTYMFILFSIMMEQYIVAYFWLVFAIYLICQNKDDELVISAIGGTLLTSLSIIPFVLKEISIKNINQYFFKFVKIGVVFVILLVVFVRVDLIENFITKQAILNSFIEKNTTISYKFTKYTQFVENCFIYPETKVEVSTSVPISLKLMENDNISYIGISIIVLAFISFMLNRKDKFVQIAAYWCMFSYIIIGIVGWGLAENGTILYSLYFGWSYLVLIVKLLQYGFNKLKNKNLLTIILIVLALFLIGININGIKDILEFAFKYYRN